jgi:hypothetical protein
MSDKAIDMSNIKPEDYGMIAMINDTYSAIVVAMIEELYKMKLISDKKYIFKASPNSNSYWIQMSHLNDPEHGECIQIELLDKREGH